MKKKSLILLITLIVLSPISVYAYCPLGENVTKDLSGILKIMQIAAPIMCIAFSIYEVIKTLTKGDASAEMKKVATRFGKRVLYTIILFFLPVLVDQVMQIADVWGADGTCDLNNSVSNDSSKSCGDASTVVDCYSISGCEWKNQACQKIN